MIQTVALAFVSFVVLTELLLYVGHENNDKLNNCDRNNSLESTLINYRDHMSEIPLLTLQE